MHEGPNIPLQKKGNLPWPLIGILVAVLIFIVVFWLAGRQPTDTAPVLTDVTPPPAPTEVELTDINLTPSPATDVAGAGAAYVQGRVTNHANTPLSAILVEVRLYDQQGNVVQRETQPLVALEESDGMPREVPFSEEPLDPNQSRPFRMAITRVPEQWNKGEPELRVARVTAATEAAPTVTPDQQQPDRDPRAR